MNAIATENIADTDEPIPTTMPRELELKRLAELEQRVQEGAAYARSLIECSIDALATISPQGVITDVNQQMESLTGRSRDELIGTPFRQYFTDPERAEAGVRLVLETGKVTDYELVACSRDGRQTPVAYNASTFYNQQHALQGVFAAARDITDRKKMEQDLRDKQIYTRTLIESRIDALATISPDGLITDVNQHMEELTGCPRQELIGSPFRHYFTDPERAEAGVRRVLETGKVTDYELIARSRDGRETPVAYNASTYYNQQRELQGVFAAARDITDRKRAEESLRRSEERYRSLTIATAQIVWTTNPEGMIVGELPSWSAYTGMSTDQIQGWGWIDAVAPDDHERTAALWSKALQERSLYETEYRLRRRDGEYRQMVARGVPVLEPDGSVREWIGTCTDITDRKLAEQELARAHAELEDKVRERTADLAAANQELEAFTYSVSHDLRAPLRHVDSFAKLLSDHLGSAADEQTGHYVGRIRSGAERMSRLIEDLLNLCRVGRQELYREPTPLREIVDAVIRELEVGDRRIEWKVGPLPTANCDPALIKQVFCNLLGNAVKFTGQRERAVVEIGLVPSGQNAIYVRDNGVGFDMKYADKLFGAFQRLHPPEQFPGTGIGLATVRRIVVKHGGQIWAEAAPDAGATFYFTLGSKDAGRNNSGSNHNAN